MKNQILYKITLMRHGEAVGSPDRNRQLTTDGQTQSRLVGGRIRDLGAPPDFVLCSGVDRTRQTLTATGFSALPTVFCDDDLYQASSVRDVLDLISTYVPDGYHHPLIIGHNPTIHETARYLSRESDPGLSRDIQSSYMPSTACLFEFHSDDWNMLHPSLCQLIHVIST